MIKKSYYTFILLLFLTSIYMIPTIYADIYPTITVNPSHPEPKGNVSFMATIQDGNITGNVVIFVEECTSEVCYGGHINQTMTKNDTGVYQTTITLRHENATEMKYRIGYLTSIGWIWYPNDVNNLIAVRLDTKNKVNNQGDSSESPGFESFGVLFTVFLISFIMYIRRK